MKTVMLVNRRPHQGQFSYENVFTTIGKELRATGWDIIQYVSPLRAKGIFPRLYNTLHMILHRGDGDVCHIVGEVTAYLALSLRRRSLVITIHDLNNYESKSGVIRFLVGLICFRIPLQRARFVTAISEFTRKSILKEFNISAERVLVIPNPLTAGFEFESKKPIDPKGVIDILQMGTKKNKNLGRVVEAMEALSSRYRIRLTVVGVLPATNFPDDAKGFEVIHHVNLEFEKIVALYQQTHLVLFASTYEGFGLPIIEAQSVGRPVVTSNLEPMTDVAGGAAQLVDPLSVDDITRGVERLITDSRLADELVERGLENVRRFSVERIAGQYANLYAQMSQGTSE